MIDISLLRDQPEHVRALLKKKEPSFDSDTLITRAAELKVLQRQVEDLRQQRNELARQGATDPAMVRERARALGEQLKDLEQQLVAAEVRFKEIYLCCPNLPADDVPLGGKEQNEVVRTFGKQPDFSFTPQHHLALNEVVKWFDFEAAARMTGSQFVLYQGIGARLIYSLALFMMQHNQHKGYSLILPPYLVTEASLEGASEFPKFRGAVYELPEDGLYLTPTAEANLTNLYRDHTFAAEELPVRMTAWTSCFRREAGSYGANERGLIRIHQFEKVELYTLCTPEQARQEHERMLACGEEILQKLGLHYRVSLLAAQDSSFAATKTYDIEVWMPGQGIYKEVSSSSYCTDFQSRRCSIRYRAQQGGKSHLVHTLNSSSLALPRLMVALMETYQQPDGTIQLPDILNSITWSLKGA